MHPHFMQVAFDYVAVAQLFYVCNKPIKLRSWVYAILPSLIHLQQPTEVRCFVASSLALQIIHWRMLACFVLWKFWLINTAFKWRIVFTCFWNTVGKLWYTSGSPDGFFSSSNVTLGFERFAFAAVGSGSAAATSLHNVDLWGQQH